MNTDFFLAFMVKLSVPFFSTFCSGSKQKTNKQFITTFTFGGVNTWYVAGFFFPQEEFQWSKIVAKFADAKGW